jgi:RimJ/RimL family protein N-acetyltransferase
VSISIRRARPDDVDFIAELTTLDDVDPFLSARRATTRGELLEEIERSQNEPEDYGRFVIEVDGERAGVMLFRVDNKRSRVASLGGLAVHPDFRGRHVSDEAARLFQRHLIRDLGYHRLQLEIYGFNERAIRHAERAGFVKEGVKRKAYWRHGEMGGRRPLRPDRGRFGGLVGHARPRDRCPPAASRDGLRFEA